MGPTDAELVARVLARDDPHAFTEIVRRHQSLVRSLLRRLTCGDQALADDLAQETFLRAYRGLARYQGKARLSSWLYRIAYNVFLSERERVRPVVADDEPGALADESPAPDRELLQHDLEQAMRVLTPEERMAITLSYRQGASHGEVAEIMECPVGTVKTHIARGKEKLEKRLRAWAS
jgi:RNA polymerase sigma factor (sigma-70 family)